MAQAFFQREMAGRDFAYNYERIERSLPLIKKQLGLPPAKPVGTKKTIDAIRGELSVDNIYATGILDGGISTALGATTRTVWLSDDTLIKQINSRHYEYFGVEKYANIPEIIASGALVKDGNNMFVAVLDRWLVRVKLTQKKMNFLS